MTYNPNTTSTDITDGTIAAADLADGIITGGTAGTGVKIAATTITNANIANTTIDLTTKVTGTLPVANGGTGITSLGTGVATFLGTPSSANLISAVTDETGTGALVFGTSPSLTTPTIGVATATSINKVAITAPATGSTLTIADGKTLTANNSIQLSGTDGTTMTFPSTSATIARTDSPTFTGTTTVANGLVINGSSLGSMGIYNLNSVVGGSYSVYLPASNGQILTSVAENRNGRTTQFWCSGRTPEFIYSYTMTMTTGLMYFAKFIPSSNVTLTSSSTISVYNTNSSNSSFNGQFKMYDSNGTAMVANNFLSPISTGAITLSGGAGVKSTTFSGIGASTSNLYAGTAYWIGYWSAANASGTAPILQAVGYPGGSGALAGWMGTGTALSIGDFYSTSSSGTFASQTSIGPSVNSGSTASSAPIMMITP